MIVGRRGEDLGFVAEGDQAEAVALAEVARRECLGGMTAAGAELVVRLENTANRSLRRIGLAKASPKAAGPNLAEFLAARVAKGGS